MVAYSKIRDYIKKHRQNTILRRVWFCIASVVVFVTTYMLILPAITLETQPACGMTEHVHNELDCYSNEGELLCRTPEHMHTIECYPAEPTISGNSSESLSANEVLSNDVSSNDNVIIETETSKDWEQIIAGVELSGDWATDLISIAQSQLGYQEKMGYTRYGEWYGEPYKEWSALFVSFCLYYAQVGEEIIPRETDCQLWIERLTEESCNRYQAATAGMPLSGDLIFLDLDADALADHVGIVDEVLFNENLEYIELKVIEGDSDNQVKYNTYSLTDDRIVGYGQIAERIESPEEEPIFNFQKSFTDEKVIITASYTEAAQIPEEAELFAYQVTEETAPERYEQRQEETRDVLQNSIEEKSDYLIYNIGFYIDGQELEPADKVTVSIQFLSEEGFAIGDPITIIHFTEDGAETLHGTDVKQNENGELMTTFEATTFSDYAIVADVPSLLAETEEVKEVSTTSDFVYYLGDRILTGDFNGIIKLTNNLTVASTCNIGSGRNVTIDLNGYNLTANGTLANITDGGILEIVDSAGASVENADVSGKTVYGNEATYNAVTDKWTYYVTETNINDTATGATEEILKGYTISEGGCITGSDTGKTLFSVENGTLTITGGIIADCANRAVDIRGGTLNLNGGYLFGNTISNGDGGAIYARSDNRDVTVNLSGTVLAGNVAENGNGGAIAIVGRENNVCTLNITGGVISGNTAAVNGGGIWASGSIISMDGENTDDTAYGYVTNNISRGEEYREGGGGILLGTNTEFTLNNGYITGNLSKSGGGGIYASEDAYAKFYMEGGFITANYAENAEAGGVRIDPGCEGIFEAGYVTNNITAAKEHWGGGGIFIAEEATANLTSVLITNNDAGGFGGGVAGCSTGRIYMSSIEFTTEGAAIFGNTAYQEGQGEAEPHLSGAGSTKAEDHVYAYNNPVFMASGYQDYFCMLYSHMIDNMLGGGSENWSGSVDGVAVTIPPGGEETGNSVTGMSANPSSTDRVNAMNSATFYVNGNSAYTHGGGILCNGYMVLGKIEEDEDDTQVIEGTPLYFGTRIELSATKEYIGTTGIIPMSEKQFQFVVKDEDGEEVARAYNTANGDLIFDRRIVFESAGVHTYILEEIPSSGNDTNISYDFSKYKITVTTETVQNGTVTVDQQYELQDGTFAYQTVTCEKYVYHLAGIVIEKQEGGAGAWTTVQTITRASNDQDFLDEEEGHGIAVALTEGTTFTNYQFDNTTTTDITVEKEWVGEPKDSVEVELYRDNELLETQSLTAYDSGKISNTVYENYSGDGGDDVISFATPVFTRYIKIYCVTRATEYGFSLYEIEVYDDSKENVALNKEVQVSSTEGSDTESGDVSADNLVDGDTTNTRWSSVYQDEQWIIIDLGEVKKISSVTLHWENAYAASYQIQIPINGTSWTYTWKNLPAADGEGNLYHYEVKEKHMDGYLTEYEVSSTGESASYWIPADSLSVGNKYMLVSPDGATALKVTEASNRYHLGSNDKIDITTAKGTESITIGEVTIDDWYDPTQISDNSVIFTAQAYGERYRLKNSGYEDAWLSIGSVDNGKHLTSRPISEPPSSFVFDGSSLTGNIEGGDTPYTVIYALNSQSGNGSGAYTFNASTSPGLNETAKLYKLVYTAVGGNTKWTITNTPIAEVEFSLEVKKVSEEDNTTALADAEFQIYEGASASGNMLQFSRIEDGVYQLYEEGNGEAVNTLVTNAKGKIKLTGMKAGTYTLHESQAPPGYEVAEDRTFTLDENSASTKVEYTIEDPVKEYELPKTGDRGTDLYTMAGLLLLVSGAYLLYRVEKRRGKGASP